MPQFHWQARCRRCEKVTLHMRDQEDMPHSTYALLCLFCCCLFAPVWMAHFINSSIYNRNQPWRCSVCGAPYQA